MPALTSDDVIICGMVNCGGKRAEAICCDSGEWSSSTMAIGAMCSVSGWAVAAVYTEAVNV